MPKIYAKFPKYVEPKNSTAYIVHNEDEYKKFLSNEKRKETRRNKRIAHAVK